MITELEPIEFTITAFAALVTLDSSTKIGTRGFLVESEAVRFIGAVVEAS
jgi:hypothetical protein